VVGKQDGEPEWGKNKKGLKRGRAINCGKRGDSGGDRWMIEEQGNPGKISEERAYSSLGEPGGIIGVDGETVEVTE